jgi:Ni/Fe-hydrogenase subunit HybB-like protein
MSKARFAFLRRPFTWWVALLLLLMGLGAAAGILVFVRGLGVTNLSDNVPWGLWITVDLSSIALSAGAFMLSAAVYLLGLKQYRQVARTAVFVGLIGYTMALLMLLLDIGRPDRFYHGFIYWNIHSPLWEVTMCVGLYFSVLTLEVLPLFGQAAWFQARWPRLGSRLEQIHQLAPFLAIAGLCLSMLHQSSLGATYGILKARPIWYQPGLAVMFMISAMAGGLSMTILASRAAARFFKKEAQINDELLNQLSRFAGWVLAAYLYMRFWDFLSSSYTYAPGRSEAWQLLTSGPLALNFWVGELALGIALPMILLLAPPFRRHTRFQVLALLLVIGGVVAYRWDTNMVGLLVVLGRTPQALTPLYTSYVPSLVEIGAAVGVVAYGLLAFTLGVRYLNVVNHSAPLHEEQPAAPLDEQPLPVRVPARRYPPSA